jgi:uncharacterized repeat protein (TIGR01451 family)
VITTSGTGNTNVLTLTPGQTITLSFTFTMAVSDVTATATVTTTTADNTPTNNVSTAASSANAVADLSVSKVASQPNGNTASSTMSFAIVVVNAGPSTAANVTVSDVVPAGLNVLSFSGNGLTGSASGNNVSATVASLASGATATLTIVVSMSNTGSATLGYTNTASVTSTTPDPTPTNNTGTATVTVAPLADVATVVTLPANATAGTVVTGTVSYSNNGTSTAANVTGSVVVGTAGGVITTSGTGNTNVLTLTPGQTITLSFTFTMAVSDVTATATVTTTTADNTPTNNVSTAASSANAVADLSVSKVASQPNGNTASSTMSFAIVVVNAGPSTAANVTVSDVVPAGLNVLSFSGNGLTGSASGNNVSATVASLASGATATLTIVVSMSNTGSATLGYTNTASVTSTTPDPTPTNNTGTATVTVAPLADVATVVTLPANATAGTVVTGTVSYSNNGTSTAANVTGSVVVGTAGGVITTSGTGNTNVLTLTPGQTITLSFTFTMAVSDVTATATVTTTTADNTPTNNVSTAASSANAVADLSVSKVASQPNGNTASSTMSFAIVVVNAGPSTAANVTVSDVVPAGLNVLSFSGNGLTGSASGNNVSATVASLASGATATLTIVVSMSNTGSATLGYTNTASVTSTTPDPTPTNNTGTATVTVAPLADVATVVTLPANATAGTVVTGTVSYSNNGTSTAANVTGSVVVGTAGGVITTSGTGNTNVLTLTPGQTITLSFTFTMAVSDVTATATVTTVVVGSLASGSSTVTVVSYSVPAGSSTTQNWTAGVATTTPESSTTNNTVTAVTPVNPLADVSTTVSVTGQGTPGSTITATVTFTNNGPSTAQNVTGSIVLPNGSVTTVVVGSLASGSSTVTVVSYSVPAGSSTTQNWTAGVATTTPESSTTNNTVTAVTPVNPLADVSTTVSVTGQGTPGSTITATVTFTNNGPSTAQNVTGSIVLPNGSVTTVVVGSLASGSSTVTVVSYSVPAGSSTTQNWTAGVATTTPESSTTNNTVTAVTPVNPLADVSTTVSVTGQGTPGSTITATVTFTNNGPSTAQNVTGSIVLPNGSVTTVVVGSLASGSSTVTVVSYSVPAGSSTTQNWTAGVATTTPESSTTNNTVTAVTPVNPLADVTVTKVASAVNATAGQTIGYTVTVVNLGPSVAQNVTATDVLGTGLSLVSASGNNGTVSVAGASVGATTSSLAAGQTLTLVVVAQVAPSVTSGFTLTNAASATSTTPDPTPTNTITKTLTVITSADVTLTKVASVANATPGQTISYTVTLVNLGPSVAQNVTISDILSAGLSRISSSSNNGTPTQVGTSTTVVGSASLAVGQTLTLIVNATVTAATGNITNTAVGTSTTPDPTPTNTVTVVVPMNAVADVSTTLSVSGQGTPGATVTATVTFTNNGPSPAQNVTATIVLPSGTVTLVPIGTLPAGSNTITVVSYPVPAGTLTTQSWTAGVATTTPESTTANNTVTRVLGPTQADVSVTLSMPTSASPGTVVSGTVVFHNIGPVQADNVTRTLVIQSATLTAVTGATIQSGGKTATFPSVSLPPSSSVVFTFTYAIPQSGGVNATATVATTTPELSTANNLAASLTSIGSVPDLSVSLVVNPQSTYLGVQRLLYVGDNTIQVVVANVGPALAGGSALVTLPDRTTRSFTLPSALLQGQTIGFTLSWTVTPSSGLSSQTFQATVTADRFEPNLVNNDTGRIFVPIGANLQGVACVDSGRNGRCDPGETRLPGLLVKLFQGNTSTLVATGLTGDDGAYAIRGLPPGNNYLVMFFDCTDRANPSTCNAIGTTPRNNQNTTEIYGQPNNAATQISGTSSGGSSVGAVLAGVQLYPGDNTINQNLPLDPSGNMYDSRTRKAVAGVRIRLTGPVGFDPAIHMVQNNLASSGAINEAVTGASGFYQFFFLAGSPAGEYALSVLSVPAGYILGTATQGGVSQPNEVAGVVTSSFVVANTQVKIQPDYLISNGIPPLGTNGSSSVYPLPAGNGTQYVTRFFMAHGPGYTGELLNNNIPLDSVPSATAPVVLNADVSMLKSGPVEMVAGGTGTYTLAVGNGGPGSAANVVVTDNLPAGLTLLSATVQPAGALALSVTPSGVSATTNSFAAGAAATLTLVVRAEVSAVGTTVTNVASIASSTTDTNPANNTSSVATRIIGADMSMVKTGPASLAAGGTAVYVLTVINAGPSAAANVTVTDALPAGLTLLSASASSGNFTLMTTSSSLTALALAMPVGTTNIVLTVALDDLLVGTVTNVARVSNTIGDPNPSNNSGTATSAVLGADLSITKLGPPSISAAGTATYTLVIVNNGPSSAGNVTVTDVIPVGLSLLSTVASGATLTVVSTPDKMVANAPLLRAGSTATLVLTVQAAYTATGTVTNIANITSTTPDPTATNNIGSATSSIRDVEPGVILVNKTGNKTVAELGDSVQYTIRMRNTIGLPVNRVTLEDLLPAGFRYILGTARLNGVALADPAGGVGRQLVFDVGNVPGNAVFELTYYVRLGVGSQQGDGVNRATAVFPGARGLAIRSNTALFKVNVQGGVFSNEGCIVGKVFIDCDGSNAQGNEGGSRELGIPGVRLVMLDGSYVVTDSEGKYSLCGVKPQTHVIKVDRTTLPAGSRLLPSSNRNAGVGDSLFVDMKGGELARADFIEGSCSVEVLEQVKARRAQGGVAVPETRAQPQAGGVK